MNRRVFWQWMAPAVSGLLFGLGLWISGMTDPQKVIGFLRLAPGWDPSLAFVMGTALAIGLPGFAWLRRRGRPLFADRLDSPAASAIDKQLLFGAFLFGAGWGLAGFCPGPALVVAAQLNRPALVFVLSMLAGARLAGRLSARKGGLQGTPLRS